MTQVICDDIIIHVCVLESLVHEVGHSKSALRVQKKLGKVIGRAHHLQQ